MGVMLSVLVASVGAMDIIYCLAFASNQLTDGSENGGQPAVGGDGDAGLEQYRNSLRQQIEVAQRGPSGSGVTYAQDGVPYHDGYRVEQHDELRLDALMEKLRELERRSQEKDARLEEMSVQMSELERNSLEQTQIIEELRSRPVSRAASMEPTGSTRGSFRAPPPSAGTGSEDYLSVPDGGVPQIVLNAEPDTGGGDDPRPSSSKFRPIRRDSELRKSVKRRSVTSTASQEDRREELELLSRMEAEEAARVDDEEYTVIEYTRNDYLGGDGINRRHNISPIHELCHLHEDEDGGSGGRPWCPERSPEPTLAANITKPWGDIKLEEIKRKEKDVIRLSRSMSIEEEEGVRASDQDDAASGSEVQQQRPAEEPVCVKQSSAGQQLHTSESAPSNLSSHSNTPERDHANEPATLRRTTKESNLPGLLQPATEQESKGVNSLTPRLGSISPREGLEIDAGTEGDTECEDGERLRQKRSKSPRSKSPRSKSSLAAPNASARTGPAGPSGSLSPRPRYKERKRIARSLTPINYDQTFMDSFTDQHLSVTPSELEDYINSMDEINFVPPEPVRPSYLYPTKATGDIPSLVLTDDQGTDAQFHDDLSSKSFYGQSHPHAGVTLNHRVSYVEWIRKFPDNQTSHLTLEDFDSDDEEVENIIRKAAHDGDDDREKFPTEQPKTSVGTTPQLTQPEVVASPEVVVRSSEINGRTEFPLNLTPAYATPSPVSQLSDLSEPSSRISSQPPTPSGSSSLALGSPLLGSTPVQDQPPANHFTPLSHSPSPMTNESDAQRHHPQAHAASTPTSTSLNTAPPRTNLTIPGASRTPSLSPLPADITPEELVFEIGHLDGLIFEARSREPTPSRNTTPQVALLSPDELAFDIGNLGGLILGPPSRSVSPAPPPFGPTSSSWEMIEPDDGQTQDHSTKNTTSK